MRKFVIMLLLFCLCSGAAGYALDWKKLHEEADRETAADIPALTNSAQTGPEALYRTAIVLLNRHKDREAGETFAKLAEVAPDSTEVKWGRAEVLRRQHQPDAAKKLLQGVIASDAKFAPAYISLADIRYFQGNFNECERLAQKVLRMGERVDISNRVRAFILLGGAKGMIAHYGGPVSKLINGSAILANLKAAEKLQPNAAVVKFGLGTFYFLAPRLAGGDLAKAESYLQEAIKRDPLFANAYVRLAQFYRMKGNKERFRFYLKAALEIDPQNELALDAQSGKCSFICAAD